MNAKLIDNPKALHNIIWISALGLGILFIIMGLVLVVVGAEMNTKPEMLREYCYTGLIE
jgi:hypothetical protein